MKYYLEIENLRENNIEIAEGITRVKNDIAFEFGDEITITEKYDGANASITFEDGHIKVFSHKKELDPTNTLQGFYNYAIGLDDRFCRDNPGYVFFGEWNLKNAVVYNIKPKTKWLIFDIFDKEKDEWLYPENVKNICKKYGLEYISELYVGPFISWDECRKYSHKNTYGDIQEGIVVRDVSKMHTEIGPWIIKIVNDKFKETKESNHKKKIDDPEKIQAKEKARELMESIVTKRRVEKMLCNLRDDGILPDELVPKDMQIVAKNLPKRIFEDCLKEEKEIVCAAGEYAGKECSRLSMNYAKEIILGN